MDVNRPQVAGTINGVRARSAVKETG